MEREGAKSTRSGKRCHIRQSRRQPYVPADPANSKTRNSPRSSGPPGAEHTGGLQCPASGKPDSPPAAGQHARSARIILPCRGCSNGLMYSHAPRSSLACFRAVTERRTLTEGAHQASPRCRARASAEPARSASTCALSRTCRTGSRSGDLGRLSSGITVTC